MQELNGVFPAGLCGSPHCSRSTCHKPRKPPSSVVHSSLSIHEAIRRTVRRRRCPTPAQVDPSASWRILATRCARTPLPFLTALLTASAWTASRNATRSADTPSCATGRRASIAQCCFITACFLRGEGDRRHKASNIGAASVQVAVSTDAPFTVHLRRCHFLFFPGITRSVPIFGTPRCIRSRRNEPARRRLP